MHFLIFISFFYQILCQPPVPGLDYLMSGFDAAKMVSSQVAQSKYKIFDINLDGGVITLNNKQYTSSQIVQATSMSIKKQASCEGVYYSFSEFYRHYTESTTVGIGVGVANFSLMLNYHKDLLQIYDSINTKQQAVGSSQAWWGMYSMSLPPPFLMPLNKFFSQSLDMLNSNSKNPTTEAQQTMYNQVIDAFGTHYVSSLIMGATMKTYTSVNSEYHHTVDYSKMSEQIGLEFTYYVYKFKLDHSAEEILNKTDVDFRKNSNANSYFTPSPTVKAGQSEWDAWEEQSPENPQVVNSSVAILSDLALKYPEVQAHMKKTIEYYIIHGVMPKLTDLGIHSLIRLFLNSLKPTLSLGDSPTIPKIIGLDVVGCGYDVMSLEPRMCIVDINSQGDIWKNPNYPVLQYEVPFGFIASNKPESLDLQGNMVFSSFKDFVIHTYWEHDETSGGFFGIGAKHKHTEIEHYYEKFYKQYYNLALALRQITWYKLSLPTFPKPKLSFIFNLAIDKLPSVYNSDTELFFQQFIDSFGTHLVVEADLGGLVWAEDWFETCLLKTHDETWVREQSSRRWAFFSSSHHSSSDYKDHSEVDYQKFSESHSSLLGGTDSLTVNKWEEWVPSVKYNPKPITRKLRPIYELLPEGPKKDVLKLAINDILNKAEMKVQQDISEMESLRPPPASQCVSSN